MVELPLTEQLALDSSLGACNLGIRLQGKSAFAWLRPAAMSLTRLLQVPLGAGLGLAHKIRKDGHAAFVLYGDGAANQGQVAEVSRPHESKAADELDTIYHQTAGLLWPLIRSTVYLNS